MQSVGIIPELGEVLTHYHHMFNRTDTACCQIKMGMVAYLGADHHMFNKTDTTCQQANLGMVANLGAVQTLYVGTGYCHHIFMSHKYHVKHTSKQCNLDCLKSGSKGDTNEMTTCAVPMHDPQTNTLW